MLNMYATPSLPCVASQVVAFTTATKSAVLSANTNSVTITVSAAAYVVCGDTSIVATAANGAYMAVNVPRDFIVPPGCFLSFLQQAAGGNAFITEWNR